MRIQLEPRLEALTENIIRAAFEVSNTLGHGFLEAVYRKALIVQLRRQCMTAEEEVPYKISYLGEQVGVYMADLVVEGSVIVELKAVEALTNAHRGQLLNYLRASGSTLGLLLNFGKPRLEVRRVLA